MVAPGTRMHDAIEAVKPLSPVLVWRPTQDGVGNLSR
jgi:hypothetical protein